jgi:hypothetical protein
MPMRSLTLQRPLQQIAVFGAICVALVLLPAQPPAAYSTAPAADTPVYADTLASGWEDWSWDTTVNLANAAPVHSGGASVAATYVAADGGLYLHKASALAGSSYSAVRFWIHGGGAGGPQVQFKVITADDQNWDNFAALTPQANTWTQVTVSLSSVGSPPTIAGLVWQDASGGVQPAFFVDDVTLVGTQQSGAYAPLAVNENASVDGFASNQFTWYDSSGKARTAALVKNDRQDPAGRFGGYLRQYTYSLGATTRVVNGTGVNGHPGFGFTTNHFGANGSSATLSDYYQGTYRAVLRGRHHAIHEFKWRLNMGAPVDATVRWFFATGRDHPLWIVTFDSSPAGPNTITADTRAPYGDMHWDGGANSEVAGVGWGDRYKFRSLNSPVTMASGWDYSQPNTIPYVIEWANNPDAEMGLVQTQTYLQHDAGGYWFYDRWGTSDANGPMPEDFNWTYQLNQYELPSTTRSKRMAWGSNFGAVGQTSYLAYGDDRNLVGYPYQSYSVFVVLDKHSLNPVADQVSEIETAQKTTLSATVGTVVTSGPAGIGRSDSVTYAPAGYNQIYSTWNVRANNSNQATFNINVAQGALVNPVLVIHNYTAATAPLSILVNGVSKSADVGYFASVDPANQQLWLTLKGSFSGTSTIRITNNAPALNHHDYLPLVCSTC